MFENVYALFDNLFSHDVLCEFGFLDWNCKNSSSGLAGELILNFRDSLLRLCGDFGGDLNQLICVVMNGLNDFGNELNFWISFVTCPVLTECFIAVSDVFGGKSE